MRRFFGILIICATVTFFAGCFMALNGLMGDFNLKDKDVGKPSILVIKLEGVILDGEKFLEDLKKYAKEDDIKGVLIQVNSPGGVVGPSQELYAEIKRVRTELKKPVVVSSLGLMASGAYYAAVAADKIVVNPGALVGSIGVIMEFANLEGLYDWAKIKRYVIKTGAYKDSGAEYRPMRDDEKLLFQEMANEVLAQFKATVAEGRKLPLEFVTKYADGRVFTGAKAVELGFADQVGTFEDARRLLGKLTKLGDEPEIFEIPKKRPSIMNFLSGNEEAHSRVNGIEAALREILGETLGTSVNAKLRGQPLFLMPGVL